MKKFIFCAVGCCWLYRKTAAGWNVKSISTRANIAAPIVYNFADVERITKGEQ